MHRLLLPFCLIVAAFSAWAADNGGAMSGPNADSPPLQPDVVNPSAGQRSGTPQMPANCPARPPLAEGAPSGILVELDPDTLWRPRGSEVRFTIRNPGGTVAVSRIRVCFGWTSPDGAFRNNQALVGSPLVRSVSNSTGVIEYGAVVPLLRPIPNSDWWPRRAFSSTPYIFSGAFTVPVADMVVEVTMAEGPVVVTTTEVGVTNVAVACVVVAVVAVLVWMTMDGIARYRQIKGRNLLLRIISTQDGYASLSQMQVVLWTLVVGLSAIYVMTLSGNLISISDGTLVLLGIASGAALIVRIPALGQSGPDPAAAAAGQSVPVSPDPAATQAGQPAAVGPRPVPAQPVTPEWSDLVIPDRSTREIDVTRLQMFAFTLITAAFVVIKVVVDYEIPTIPANFLVLMGISNGVYVGGTRLPSQPKNPVTGPVT